ncbi:zinc finger protein 771-like [Toxotes jaculatrix]|uniref:zinc finger protein 771-like n=1 Tax=Toxotes jaculatrix TaxID=941984 RepID=UPI001B3AEB17|nr:zinc finger protein 771-like [Toxotes jaculatrix]
MSAVELLRELVDRRLTAAAEEIIGLFERTIAEYEAELGRSERENERQRKLLDAVFTPEVRLHRAVLSADTQQSPEPPHIKEEQEQLWSSQEGQQLQRPVSVKSEGDEEKVQSSQLHHRQTEEDREAEPPPSSSAPQVEADSDGQGCGGSEPSRGLDVDNHLRPVNDDDDETPDFCGPADSSDDVRKQRRGRQQSQTKRSTKYAHLVAPKRTYSGEKAFVCLVCKKQFNSRSSAVRHLRTHTGEKPFGCPVCGRKFSWATALGVHMRTHTGERPFSCTVCGKKFTLKGNVAQHMTLHTGEKAFGCGVCGRRYTRQSTVRYHKCVSERVNTTTGLQRRNGPV